MLHVVKIISMAKLFLAYERNNFPKMKGTPGRINTELGTDWNGDFLFLIKTFTLNHGVILNDESRNSTSTIAGLSDCVTTTVCKMFGLAISVRRNRKHKCEYNIFEETSVNSLSYTSL